MVLKITTGRLTNDFCATFVDADPGSNAFNRSRRPRDLDTSKIDQVLGRSGQKMGDVYRVGFPRTDLHVVVEGLAIKPGLAWDHGPHSLELITAPR